jgi:hypothetical protein
MNPEPIYTFVRGKGWIVSDDEVIAVHTRHYAGRTYRLTFLKRKPNPGESGWYCGSYYNRETNQVDYTMAAEYIAASAPYERDNVDMPRFGWVYVPALRPNIEFETQESRHLIAIIQEDITP